MRLFIFTILTSLTSYSFAETSGLERAIDAKWEECREAIYRNELKGEPLFEEDTYLSEDDLINRKKYFEVPDSAIEKFIISEQGQVAHALYWHKLLCVKDTMNEYCGSSGCSYDFVINDKIYELHGGSPPIIAEFKGKPVVLVGRSGGHCKTGPNAASCVKAYIWDDKWQQFNTPGGHRRPIR